MYKNFISIVAGSLAAMSFGCNRSSVPVRAMPGIGSLPGMLRVVIPGPVPVGAPQQANRDLNAGSQNAAGATPVAPSELPPLRASISEVAAGPFPANVSPNLLFFSPDATRAAVMSRRGSRTTLYVDGTAGPIFDELSEGLRPLSISWSNDSRHLAYLGRRGNAVVPIIDGSEGPAVLNSGNTNGLEYLDAANTEARSIFLYSPSGLHLAYITGVPTSTTSPESSLAHNRETAVVLDGKMGPTYELRGIVPFGFVGERFLYVARRANGKFVVNLDGNDGPEHSEVDWVIFSPNRQHFAYRVDRSKVIVDGLEHPVPQGANPLQLSNGGRLVSSIRTENPRTMAGEDMDIYVDDTHLGKDLVPFEEPGVESKQYVAFSADERRIAYVVMTAGSDERSVVVDGNKELAYRTIQGLHFGPVGSRYTYVGEKHAIGYAVVDGKEDDGSINGKGITFSSDGMHAFYQIIVGDHLQLHDGGQAVAGVGTPEGEIILSPDGHHYAIQSMNAPREHFVVVDGQAISTPGVSGFAKMQNNDINVPPILFSPDGAHFVYTESVGNGSVLQHLVYDGKAAFVGSNIEYPTFSPDGRHFAFATRRPGSQQQFTLIVDFKTGPTCPSLLSGHGPTLRFIDNSTLQFYAIKDETLYRTRLVIGQ